MKLFIPKLGTKITLLKPWTFKLEDEHRNEKFFDAIHGEDKRTIAYYGYGPSYQTNPTPTAVCRTPFVLKRADPTPTTLPKGTELFIERIYIRKGAGKFDSMTFRILKGGPVPAGRFWVNISEINGKMEIETEYVEKYPNGKFTLQISEGVVHSRSCGYGSFSSCSCPKYTKQYENPT